MWATSAGCRRLNEDVARASLPALLPLFLTLLAQTAAAAPLIGQTFGRAQFPNPHAHIPAQCYVETGGGTQNACLFCHTDGVWRRGLGNNNLAHPLHYVDVRRDGNSTWV